MTTEELVKDAPADQRSCATCRWFTEAADTSPPLTWCHCYMSPQYGMGAEVTKPCNLYWQGMHWRQWVPTGEPGGFALEVNPKHCKTVCIYFSKETSRHYGNWSVYDVAPCGGWTEFCCWPCRASEADIAAWRQKREDVELVRSIEELGRQQ